jgi:fatty acid desaturase 2 (delta-6 desaturase)
VVLRWTFYLHPKYCWIKKNYFELLCILLHFTPVARIGIANFLLAKWLWSMKMFGIFSLSHTHLEATEEPKHWVEYAFCNTININSSPFMDWWMGFLNFQIEHHLFPTMPEFRNPMVKERVKEFAKEFGLPYKELSFSQAVVHTLGNLQNVSDEVYRSKPNK